MQGKLIGDRIMETFEEELGCKHPISRACCCKRGVSQLNGGGYSP